VSDKRANVPDSGSLGWLSALLFSTGFQAVTLYRFAHACSQMGPIGRVLGRILQRCNVLLSACHIHRNAIISPGLNLPHATGIVIGAGVQIGSSVTIYQNVTLGVRSVNDTTFPCIGDGVTIFAGAVIVGPVQVGNRAIVGANAVVTHDVPSDYLAVGVPAKSFIRTT